MTTCADSLGSFGPFPQLYGENKTSSVKNFQGGVIKVLFIQEL